MPRFFGGWDPPSNVGELSKDEAPGRLTLGQGNADLYDIVAIVNSCVVVLGVV